MNYSLILDGFNNNNKKKSNQYHNPVTVQTCFEIHWTCGKHFVWMLGEKKKNALDVEDAYSIHTKTQLYQIQQY